MMNRLYGGFQSFLILLICLVVFVLPSRAEVRVGVKAGASFSTQDASGAVLSEIDRPMRKGFAAGVVCEYSLSSVLWLRAEPMYVQKGSEVDWPSKSNIFDNTYEIEYLVLPVNLKATMDYGSVSPFVFAGPYFGQALSGTYVMKIDGSETDAVQRDFEFGLDFGGGADIRVRDDLWITIDARYSLGLTDVDDSDNSSFKNRGATVLAGVLLEL